MMQTVGTLCDNRGRDCGDAAAIQGKHWIDGHHQKPGMRQGRPLPKVSEGA